MDSKLSKIPVGVVLSGGSIKGSAHVGFLERLSEIGVKPGVIAGSSAGALIGAFYAAGKSFEEMLEFLSGTPMFTYNSFNPLKPGIFNSDKYESVFREFLPDTFEDLEIPLIICATNAETGKASYFSKGDLIKPLLASCAIPVIFAPVEIDGMLHIDGGVLDNFPVEQVEDRCNIILGSYLGATGPVSRKDVNSKLKISYRTSELHMNAAVAHKLIKTDITLSYPLQEFSYFDQKKIKEIYKVGYEFALKNIDPEIFHSIK